MLKDNSGILCPKCVDKIKNYLSLLIRESYTELSELECTAYKTAEPVPFSDRFSGVRQDIRPGDKWGENQFDCAWMRLQGELPEDADVLILDLSGEGLLYTDGGEIVQSITCGSSAFDLSLGSPKKRIVPIYGSLVKDGRISFWVDAAANDLFGNLANDGKAIMMSVAHRNDSVRDLSYDVSVLLDTALYTKDEEFAKEIVEKLAGIASDRITEAEAEEQLAVTSELIARGDDDLSDCMTLYAIGHAHLDLAWLWPVRETWRKGARTFATQLRNRELYRDAGYIFGESQAQLYRWMKERYPELYEQAKKLVAEGKWDVQGSTWVEPDSNLTCGESLCRQFFYGKRFFKEEFGLERDIFWVPDSFGYSGCLPQIMRLAGVRYFLTQKMSWNIYNKFPYQSFYWKGIDGTSVLSHMLPEETYNSGMRGHSIAFAEQNYHERNISDKSMMLFGIGDGGAGPGYEHIEQAVRFANMRGMPKVKFSDSETFFRDFDDGVTPYPTFEGELYLERHQGTYTTHSDNKKYNRKCEFALQNYEKLSAVLPEGAASISHAELEEMWKEILFYQFHDILPGSSINRVYEECVPHYKQIYNKLTNTTAAAASAMAGGKAVVNFNSFPYDVTLKHGRKWYRAAAPALGMAKVGRDDEIKTFSAQFRHNAIENDKVVVTFRNGFICSIFDKELGREFIPKDRLAAVLSQYDDYGDSWDMVRECAAYVQTKKDAVCTAFEAGTDGPKAIVEAAYEGKGFKAKQTFYIIDGDNTVYCDLKVDLQIIRSMIRIAFPFDVDTEEATFNIQYGHLRRRMTENNSVELAQFEVSGQKFADMSDANGGVALINDCKYGYRAKNGVLDLNLVRSPEGNPGHDIDLGEHEIRYAIMPHAAGDVTGVYSKAYFVNNPPVITDGEPVESSACGAYSSDNAAIIIDTVKIPEDGNGIIVRAYNCTEDDQTAVLSFKGYRPAQIVGIMEDKLADAGESFDFHRFELKNIRFVKE